MLSSDQSSGKLAPETLVSNRYRIIKLLGTGGMGSVYLAQDIVLEEATVAIKILHEEMSRDPEVSKRFLREISLMNKVNHPNVVRTFDVGREENRIYFTMEFLQGTPLDEISRDKSLSIAAICNLVKQVCGALKAIHDAEIIHRDLKPANIILLENQSIKLTDFGVAKTRNSKLTQHDEIIGSVEYMAPEVWLGKELSPATDLYSLGIIMYELLTGTMPFESDQPATMMWMHVKKPALPPKGLREEIPAWLNQLVMRLLSKNPEERPRSAKEVETVINNHANRLEATGSFSAQNPQNLENPNTTSGKFPTVSQSPNSTGSFSQITAGNRRSGFSLKQKRVKAKKRLMVIALIALAIGFAINRTIAPFLIEYFPH